MRSPTTLAPRRAVLSSALALIATTQPARQAIAFDNRLPPDELELKYKSPRTPGPKPMDLGPRGKNGLKSCIDGKPHCFSSSAETFDDADLFNADSGSTDWLVEPFKYDKPLAEAVSELKDVIASYPPGQNGIDGGGFKLMDSKVSGDTSAYLYVQFESLRKGYIDDFEIALADGVANVRTSSRLGYLDLGVNAKRYQWFADKLGKTKGWKTTPLRMKGHEEYFSQNRLPESALKL